MENLKPTNIRTSQGNIQNLAQLKPNYECMKMFLLINSLRQTGWIKMTSIPSYDHYQ